MYMYDRLKMLFVLGLAAVTVLADAASPMCNATILNQTGLHAKSDIKAVKAKSYLDCCDACMKCKCGCVAWTFTGEQCRLKAASGGATHNPASTSGIITPTPPTPSPAPSSPTPVPGPKPKDAKNVLMIVVDDLRPQMGCYGQSETLTPHLNGLAKQSLVFDRVFTQQSVCSPSRNSFMVCASDYRILS
jgi:hypothetical protein